MKISDKGVERIREHLTESLEHLLDNNVDTEYLASFFMTLAERLYNGSIK